MTKIYITGISGELGSNLAHLLLDMGFGVAGNDLARIKEAWQLSDITDRITYKWKATQDLSREDLNGYDAIIDAGCQADRPLGETSPYYTHQNNLVAPMHLLEVVKGLAIKPICIYPSSFVIFFGVPPSEQPITEKTKPRPKGVYALTKYFAEETYRLYHDTYEVPVIITRVGSCFAPGGRSDQFIHRIIIEMLQQKPHIQVWSPGAGRAYTYGEDALEFYKLLFNRDLNDFVGITLHDAGNKENKAYTNIQITEHVKRITGYEGKIEYIDNYEVTERVFDPTKVKKVPVIQHTDWEHSLSRDLLGWQPKYTIEEGLKKTVEWFKDNLWRY